ncbi:MAG: cytochrome c oxidase assembly protein [Bacillota bacterium]|nr:cytochrome c oxidase assembly protein [Bacillota bacterium]
MLPGGVAVPAEGGWRLSPLLLAAAGLLLALYLAGWVRMRRRGLGKSAAAWRALLFLAGLAAVVVAFDSPAEALSRRLVSFHVLEHQLLALVAAPLLLLGLPGPAWAWGLPAAWRRRWLPALVRWRPLRQTLGWLLRVPVGWMGFVWVFAFSLLPPVERWAHGSGFGGEVTLALFLASGVAFWGPVVGYSLHGRRLRPAAGMAYIGSLVPVLWIAAVVLLFGGRILYARGGEALPLGFSALMDQQVAGAGLLVISVLYVFAFLLEVAAWLETGESGAPGSQPPARVILLRRRRSA